MREPISVSKNRQFIRCPKCGTVVGGFGNVCDCIVPCPKCEEYLDVIVKSEELIVRRKWQLNETAPAAQN